MTRDCAICLEPIEPRREPVIVVAGEDSDENVEEEEDAAAPNVPAVYYKSSVVYPACIFRAEWLCEHSELFHAACIRHWFEQQTRAGVEIPSCPLCCKQLSFHPDAVVCNDQGEKQRGVSPPPIPQGQSPQADEMRRRRYNLMACMLVAMMCIFSTALLLNVLLREGI